MGWRGPTPLCSWGALAAGACLGSPLPAHHFCCGGAGPTSLQLPSLGCVQGWDFFGVTLRPEITSPSFLCLLHLLVLCFKQRKVKCAIALSACSAQKLNRDVPGELALISVCLPSNLPMQLWLSEVVEVTAKKETDT